MVRIVSTKPSPRQFPDRGDGGGESEGDTGKHRRVKVKWFEEVKMEAIDWLWYPYIPRGKLTILGGDPGQGKSFITVALASALSRGDPFPGQEFLSDTPKVTLLFSGEDDPGDTIKPRLYRLGADMTKIAVFDENIVFDPIGLRVVDTLVGEAKADLVIIDPIVAYLGAKMNMNQSNEVRPILKGLADIASKYHCAMVVVRHMRKAPAGSKNGKAIYNGMGSIDFTAAVRSELQVDQASNGQRYLNHIKTNVGPIGKSIRYTIADDTFSWGEQVDIEVFEKETKKVSKRFKNETAAKTFLFDLLRDNPDGVHSSDIFMKGKAAGFSQTRLEHIRGIAVKVKSGEHWLWMLDPLAKPILDEHEANVLQ